MAFVEAPVEGNVDTAEDVQADRYLFYLGRDLALSQRMLNRRLRDMEMSSTRSGEHLTPPLRRPWSTADFTGLGNEEVRGQSEPV